MTVGQYAKRWMPQVKATVKRLSALRYEQTMRLHVLPVLKDSKLRLLGRAQIKQLLIDKPADGYATPTVSLVLATVLSEQVATVLQRLQMLRPDRAKRWRWETLPEYVFTTRQGTLPSMSSIRRAFIEVLERAGLPEHHTPHSLRHSYASLLLQNGESIKFVQEQLGHASIKLTVDLYGRWAKAEPQRGGSNYLDTLTRDATDSTVDSNTPL